MTKSPGSVIWAAVLATGLLFGCTSHRSQPAWVNGTSPDYSADQYLLGVGQADSRPSAEQRAYGAVARIFTARVEAESKDWESFLALEAGSATRTERRLTLDQLTRVSTDKVLENVRVLDAWEHPQTGQHYALVGLHRAQAGTALSERLTQLDHSIESDVSESRQASEPLVRIRSLRRAMKNLVLREVYNTDLRVIRPSGQGTVAPYRISELTGAVEQVMTATLAVRVEIQGDQTDAIRRAVIEGLLREGLPVTDKVPAGSDKGKPLELLVTGAARLFDLDVPDPRFRFVRWCTDFVIADPSSRQVIGAVSRGGREGHLTQSEAQAKALRIMQQDVSSELARILAGYVYGDTAPAATLPPSVCPKETRGDGSPKPPL